MFRKRIKEELSEAVARCANNTVPSISSFMNSFRNQSVLIYGAGSFGKQIYSILKDYDIRIEAFLDINAQYGQTLMNIPVYKPDDQLLHCKNKSEALVIVAIVLNHDKKNELMKRISSLGYKNIIYGQEIRCRFIRADNYPDENPDALYYREKIDDILNCVDLWADETSSQIYKGNILSHIYRDYKFCLESNGEQYFLNNLSKESYNRFIDCGSYIGDTLKIMSEIKGKADAIAAFEPERDNFVKLSEFVQNNFDSLAASVYLFPCGVSEKTEMLRFTPMGGSSCISDQGSIYIQCVALDDALKKFNPTFIKMDIEGAEYKALLGARKMIEYSRPYLAISLYHYINHLWDIPLLVNSWGLGYRFYLRSYSACGMETIMYAIKEEQHE